jgi:hypothetical protein
MASSVQVNMQLPASKHLASSKVLRKTTSCLDSLIPSSLGRVRHLISVGVVLSTKQSTYPILTGLSVLTVEKCYPVMVMRVPPWIEPCLGVKLTILPSVVTVNEEVSKLPYCLDLTLTS